MRSRARRIVVSGSECTGKTTLALALADGLGAPWSPEAARAYAEAAGRELTAADVEPIARAQIAGEDAAEARATAGLLVCDTDLVSTVVYARHYYGACPAWIEDAARARLGDLYLLLRPDVPWVADGVRDRPERRAELHAAFEARLRACGARVEPVGGGWDERRATAEAVVAAWLGER